MTSLQKILKLVKSGTEEREKVKKIPILQGGVQIVHICEEQPQNIKIWQNVFAPGHYWLLRKKEEVCGKHIDFCPYCCAMLSIGAGDVAVVKI